MTTRADNSITLRQVNLKVGVFVGRLKRKDTGALKLCDVCGKDHAMWCHPMKRGDKNAYLCFGCGGH